MGSGVIDDHYDHRHTSLTVAAIKILKARSGVARPY